MSSVILENIMKRYGEVEVVHGVDLEIEEGEFVVFLGPSGCGKTTILRMVAGLEDVSDGQMFIADKMVNEVPPKDRQVAMVFQNYALYPHMTVRQNMEFALKPQRLSKNEVNAKICDIAGILGLDTLLERKPAQLSGGQRQRVAMGRAMVRTPKVFLFDEPLSNLDAKLRTQVRLEIAKLHKRLGTTIIYVTHDQVEAMTLADKIVIIKDGFIEQVGTPEEVFTKPKNLFVATFIGSPAMNTVSAVVKANESSATLVSDGFTIPAPQGKGNILTNGQSITIGVRPSDIHLNAEGDGECTFDALVEVAEYLGTETLVGITVGSNEMMVQIPSHLRPPEDIRVSCNFNFAKIHLFDTVTGQAV